MASKDIEAASTSPVPKKRSRLNPSRRKAAKAKDEADNQQAPVTSLTSAKSTMSLPKIKSVPVSTPTALPIVPQRQRVLPPTPLIRQKTEPLPDINHRKALTRTVTSPAANNGASLGPLALKTPALVTGGLVGCAAGAAILLGVGMWYDFAGAESAILAARAAKLCVDNLAEEVMASLKTGTYSADEALDMLRRTTLAYASTIPDGAPFVERIFREIDTVRKQRGAEIDKVVAETYLELDKASRRGAGPEQMQTIVLQQLTKLSSFASAATQDIVARNPKLRPYKVRMAKAVQGPLDSKEPTVRVNMAVRQKLPADG